jgi:hypothetical protein
VLEVALHRVEEAHALEAERSSRSVRAVLGVGLVAVTLCAASFALGAAGLTPGELCPGNVVPLAAASFVLYALTAALYLRLGPAHPLYRFADVVEDGWRSVAVMALLVLSGPLASGFLLLSLVRGFVRRAQTAARVRRTWAIQTAAHGSVSGACLWAHRPTSALLVILALFAFLLAYSMIVNAHRRALRARVERDLLERELLGLEVGSLRDRIAREIHDGVGADLLAIVLQLRREAARDLKAGAMAEEAQGVLEELRSVVWSLKGEHGTLGELGKLLAVKCARVGGAACSRLVLEGDAHREISSATGLRLLQVAPALLQATARESGASSIQAALFAEPERIGVRLTLKGPSALTAAALEPAREKLAELDGTLRAEPLVAEEGNTVTLWLPLRQDGEFMGLPETVAS